MVVRAEISGLRAEDLRVKIDRDVLRISGERNVPPRGPVKRLLRMEIAFGPFERTVRIGVPFDRDNATAQLEDGFLEVTLPKSQPRRVEVETGQ